MTWKASIAGAIVLTLLTACDYRSWTLWSVEPPDDDCPPPLQCPEHVEGAEPSLPLSPLPPLDEVCIEDPADALLIRDAAFPGNGRIMLATADGAIWTSQDDGGTWTSFGKIELPANSQSCAAWSLMPGGSDSFWINYDSALAEAGGASMLDIGVSRDGGRTFTPIVFERPLLTALVEQPECDPVIVDVYGQIWVHPVASADDASSFEASGVPSSLGNAGRACSCDDGSIVILGREGVTLTRDLGATWEPLPQLDDIRPYRMNCGSGYLWLIDSVDDVYRYDLGKESLTLVDYAQVVTFDNSGITSSVSAGDRFYVCGIVDEESTAVFEAGPDAQVTRLPDAPGRNLQLPIIGRDGSGRLWIASGGLALMSAQQDAWETVWPPD